MIFMCKCVRHAFVKRFQCRNNNNNELQMNFVKIFKAKIYFHSLNCLRCVCLAVADRWSWRHEYISAFLDLRDISSLYFKLFAHFSLVLWLNVEISHRSEFLWPFSLTQSACDNFLWWSMRWRSKFEVLRSDM